MTNNEQPGQPEILPSGPEAPAFTDSPTDMPETQAGQRGEPPDGDYLVAGKDDQDPFDPEQEAADDIAPGAVYLDTPSLRQQAIEIAMQDSYGENALGRLLAQLRDDNNNKRKR